MHILWAALVSVALFYSAEAPQDEIKAILWEVPKFSASACYLASRKEDFMNRPDAVNEAVKSLDLSCYFRGKEGEPPMLRHQEVAFFALEMPNVRYLSLDSLLWLNENLTYIIDMWRQLDLVKISTTSRLPEDFAHIFRKPDGRIRGVDSTYVKARLFNRGEYISFCKRCIEKENALAPYLRKAYIDDEEYLSSAHGWLMVIQPPVGVSLKMPEIKWSAFPFYKTITLAAKEAVV